MRRLPHAALATALLAASTVASATPFSPPGARIYCVAGSTSACFGASFLSTDGVLELWLQNVQGAFSPDPTPFIIRQFVLARANRVNADGQLLDFIDPTIDGVQPYGNGANPGVFGWSTGYPGVETIVTYSGRETAMPGIVGCTNPNIHEPDVYGQHCPRTGLDGWHRLVFEAPVFFDTEGGTVTPFDGGPTRASRHGTWDDLRFTLDGDGAGGAGVSCAIAGAADGDAPPGTACAEYDYAISTVPEPATLALLAPALAALLVARRRRRA